jgi:hypothetical protein
VSQPPVVNNPIILSCTISLGLPCLPCRLELSCSFRYLDVCFCLCRFLNPMISCKKDVKFSSPMFNTFESEKTIRFARAVELQRRKIYLRGIHSIIELLIHETPCIKSKIGDLRVLARIMVLLMLRRKIVSRCGVREVMLSLTSVPV